MSAVIREERAEDREAVARIIAAAFSLVPYASGTEARIVERLRDEGAMTLALVAEADGRVVGHVALSLVRIDGATGWHALGPIAVRPDVQGQGTGSALVREALGRLRDMDAEGCVLVGNPSYYGRFGFAHHAGLMAPPYPDEVVLGLSFGSAPPRGKIAFHPAFDGA